MKKIILLVFLALLSSCATEDKHPSQLTFEEQRIVETVDSVDSKIWGDHLKAAGNFNDFNLEFYEAYLKKYHSPRAADMREFLKNFDVKKVVTANKTFVFCAFSSRYELAFCDDAACTGTESFEKTKSADLLSDLQSNLPLKECKSR